MKLAREQGARRASPHGLPYPPEYERGGALRKGTPVSGLTPPRADHPFAAPLTGISPENRIRRWPAGRLSGGHTPVRPPITRVPRRPAAGPEPPADPSTARSASRPVTPRSPNATCVDPGGARAKAAP